MSRTVTKRALLASMKELMAEKQFATISVDDICERAAVSKRNFYRYFPDKYELLNEIYTSDFIEKMKYHDDWTVWDYFPIICEYCYENRVFIRNAIAVQGQNSPRSYWQELLTPLILNDFKDTFFTDKSADFYIPRLTNALFDFMELWLKSEPCMPPDQFAAYVRKSVAVHAKRTLEVVLGEGEEENESR